MSETSEALVYDFPKIHLGVDDMRSQVINALLFLQFTNQEESPWKRAKYTPYGRY